VAVGVVGQRAEGAWWRGRQVAEGQVWEVDPGMGIGSIRVAIPEGVEEE